MIVYFLNHTPLNLISVNQHIYNSFIFDDLI